VKREWSDALASPQSEVSRQYSKNKESNLGKVDLHAELVVRGLPPLLHYDFLAFAHPRGYRELRSNAEMRKLVDRKIALQHGKCPLCGENFTAFSDVVPDHISPRGLGGAWRDDHPDNVQAVHWWCNGEKGSSRY
jgi:hypothetical protein